MWLDPSFFHTWRAIIKVDHLTGKQCDVCMEVKITIILETEEIITDKTVSDTGNCPCPESHHNTM